VKICEDWSTCAKETKQSNSIAVGSRRGLNGKPWWIWWFIFVVDIHWNRTQNAAANHEDYLSLCNLIQITIQSLENYNKGLMFYVGIFLHRRIYFHTRSSKRGSDNQRRIVATMKDCLKLSTIHS